MNETQEFTFERTGGNPCLVCGAKDEEKPQINKGTPWCSENHRKEFLGLK